MKKVFLLILILGAVTMLLSGTLLCNADARDGGWRGHGGGHAWGHGHGWGWGWGVGWGPWWPAYYPYYPYYPSYPYYPYDPYYESSPVIIQQEPAYSDSASQQEEQSYWYFCTNPRGYYPYVKKCPGGWLRVVPSPVPPVDTQQPAYEEPVQPEKQIYWYCTKPKGYYPNVKKCPGGWQKVVLPSAPDQNKKMENKSYPDAPDQGR
ncbi:MAG TPA: hypothetical protein VMB78_10705 [Dissulfurispiraceae bacterium]|nr:hypothetical protein [Dissulfurispiraceae bacterium]